MGIEGLEEPFGRFLDELGPVDRLVVVLGDERGHGRDLVDRTVPVGVVRPGPEADEDGGQGRESDEEQIARFHGVRGRF